MGGSQRKNLAGQDLSGRDFSGVDLGGADLRLSRLNGIDLTDANVLKARFFLASGLSKEQRRELKARGAKTGFLMSPLKALFFLVIPAVLAGLLYYTATGLSYISIPALKEKISQAKDEQQYRKALQYNQELLERCRQDPGSDVFFNAALDAAKIYSLLDRWETAATRLQELYTDPDRTPDQSARVSNELARIYLDQKEPQTALSYIKKAELANIRPETLYMIEMTRALALRQQQDFAGALTVYYTLLPNVKNNPDQDKKIRSLITRMKKKIQ